jgi:hypothetical protein
VCKPNDKEYVMRNRIYGFLMLLATAALPLATAAAEQTGSQRPLPAFQQIDANQDGVLSRSELPDGLQDLRMHFSQYAYADNRITRATYERYAAPVFPMPGTHFRRPHGR